MRRVGMLCFVYIFVAGTYVLLAKGLHPWLVYVLGIFAGVAACIASVIIGHAFEEDEEAT